MKTQPAIGIERHDPLESLKTRTKQRKLNKRRERQTAERERCDAARVQQSEAATRCEQRILATYAWHLARHLIEHDKFPEELDAGRFLNWCEQYPQLEETKRIQFVNDYVMLERISEDVTARTLVATRIHGRGFFHAIGKTAVGQYLLFLAVISLGCAVGLIVLKSTVWAPFIAAGLGTCIYLLRVTQHRMKTREFDPVYVPSHLIRLFMGVLAGGSIVLIPDLVNVPEVAQAVNGAASSDAVRQIVPSIGQTAVAFLLGYAVDIYYSVLDNIGHAIDHKGS